MKTIIKIFETEQGDLLYIDLDGTVKCTNVKNCLKAVRQDLHNPVVGTQAAHLLFILKRL